MASTNSLSGLNRTMHTPSRPLSEAASQPDLFRTPDPAEFELDTPPYRKRKHPEDSVEGVTRSMNDMFKNVLTMFQDLKTSQDEQFSQMRENMCALKKQNEELLSSNAEIKKSISLISEEQRLLKLRVEQLEQNENKKLEQVKVLEQQLENVERKSRETSVEIRNLPTESNEQMMEYLQKLHELLKLNFDRRDIRSAFRLQGKQDRPRPIILEFVTLQKKIELLQAFKKYNIQNQGAKINTQLIGVTGENRTIYINERLTKNAQQLHYLAREKLVKNGSWKFCWTARGKVFLRKQEGQPIVEVKSAEQVDTLSGAGSVED